MDEFTDAEPVDAYGSLDEGILVAGDRAPDAPGLITVVSRAETRLFDVFSLIAHVHSDALTMTGIFQVLQQYPADETVDRPCSWIRRRQYRWM